jgi:acyl dehydratase
MSLRVPRPHDLIGLDGELLGPTDWAVVTEHEIADFEASTGDRAYLALALVNRFLPELLTVEECSMGVNVGLDGARFGPPLAAADRIRGSGTVASATEVGDGVQVTIEVRIEVDGAEPACIAETVSRFFP